MGDYRFPWQRLTDARRAFVAARDARRCSDDSFVEDVVHNERGIARTVAAAVRKALSQQCGVHHTLIYASDRCKDIDELMGSESIIGWLFAPTMYDYHAFFMAIERELATSFGRRVDLHYRIVREWPYFAREPRGVLNEIRTVGEWAREITRNIVRDVQEQCIAF